MHRQLEQELGYFMLSYRFFPKLCKVRTIEFKTSLPSLGEGGVHKDLHLVDKTVGFCQGEVC